MLVKSLISTVLLASVAVATPVQEERNILSDAASAIGGAVDTLTSGAVGAFNTVTGGAASVATNDIAGAWTTATDRVASIAQTDIAGQSAAPSAPAGSGSGAQSLVSNGAIGTGLAAAAGVVVGYVALL